ncbi:UNVERIFIED_CONTAM: hypothetical protein RMT77_001103 [Armadillidium vulgare]
MFLQFVMIISIYSSGVFSISIPDIIEEDILEGLLGGDILQNNTLDDSLLDIVEILNNTISLGVGCLNCGGKDVVTTLLSCLEAADEATDNLAVAAVSTVICVFGECNGLGLLDPIDCPPGGCSNPPVDGPTSKRRKRQADPLNPLFEYVDIIVCQLVNPVVTSVFTLSLDTIIGVLNI